MPLSLRRFLSSLHYRLNGYDADLSRLVTHSLRTTFSELGVKSLSFVGPKAVSVQLDGEITMFMRHYMTSGVLERVRISGADLRVERGQVPMDATEVLFQLRILLSDIEARQRPTFQIAA